MSVGETRQLALSRALSNAKHFKRPYYVFCDTNGSWWVEREHAAPSAAAGQYGSSHKIVFPDGTYEDYDPAVGPPAHDVVTGLRRKR